MCDLYDIIEYLTNTYKIFAEKWEIFIPNLKKYDVSLEKKSYLTNIVKLVKKSSKIIFQLDTK